MRVLLTSTRWLSLLLDRLKQCRRRGNRLLGLLRGCICWRLCRSALRVTLLNLHGLRGFCLHRLLLRVCFFRGLGVLGFNGGRWGLLGCNLRGRCAGGGFLGLLSCCADLPHDFGGGGFFWG